MSRVLIIQSQVKQYRIPFFIKLHEALQTDSIQLRVAYSQPAVSEGTKKDDGELPESFSVRVRAYSALRERCLYQPLIKEIARADLVIVEQANKHIINHVLLLLRFAGLKCFGFWGLGNNKQADRSRLSEWYKRITVKWADSYFAYTAAVAREVAVLGVPEERITVVQNATDTREFRNHILSIKDCEIDLLRTELRINNDASVGLFCGMLDSVKGIPFLIDCSKLIRSKLPEFHLILVGGGREQSAIQQLVQDFPWVHAVGLKFGRDKALFFKLSDLLVLPGRVGLVILDSFAAGLPLITVQIPIHGPEVEYLQEGVNGFMVPRDVTTYADAVVRVLKDRGLLLRLRAGALKSADNYSIEAMVQNFRAGIVACLQPENARGLS